MEERVEEKGIEKMDSEEMRIEDFIGEGYFNLGEHLVSIDEIRYHPASNASYATIQKVMHRIEELAQQGFHSFSVKNARNDKKPSVCYLPPGIPTIWDELVSLNYGIGYKEALESAFPDKYESIYADVVEAMREEWVEGCKAANKFKLQAKLLMKSKGVKESADNKIIV